MGAERPFIGREAELSRAAAALREGRSALLVGSAGIGKSRLLAEVVRLHAPTVRADRSPGRIAIHGGGLAVALDESDPSACREVLDAHWVSGSLLAVDDIDTLPRELSAAIARRLVDGRLRLVASAARRSNARKAASTPVDEPIGRADIECVELPVLSFAQTRSLGEAQSDLMGVRRPDDAWLAALHRLTGGIPALIVEVVADAVSRARLSALEPLDLRSEPVPGMLLRLVRRLVDGLDDPQLRTVALLDELGGIPSTHLAVVASASDVSALLDARLLFASTDAADTAVGGLVAWMARQRVAPDRYRRQCADVARRLIEAASRGTSLTAREEFFCARHSAGLDVDDLSAGERRVLHGMLHRASSAIAHSRTPGDAQDLAERAARMAVSPPTPAMRTPDRAEGELVLYELMTDALDAQLRGEALPSTVQGSRSWFPADPSWQVHLDGVERVLDYLIGAEEDRAGIPDIDDLLAPVTHVSADALAWRAACHAVVDAMRGDTERALTLIRPRLRVHGLDTEPVFAIVVMHACVLVIIGEEREGLGRALRRRLAVARAADRQDQVQVLAVIAAALHFVRGDAREVFASLGLIETDPRPSLSVWVDLLRACAHILTHDSVSAATLLAGVSHVPEDWAGGGFAGVREIAHVLFDLATAQTATARVRAFRAARAAAVSLPVAVASFFRLARAAGATVEELSENAGNLPWRDEIPPLRVLLAGLRQEQHQAGPGAWSMLTIREREVASLAARRLSTVEIARTLGISTRTVESHLHHARVRLGMSRSQRFAHDDRTAREA